MKLIAERLGRNDKLDRLRCIRADGSETRCAMPRQGTLPHDLVHYAVESLLPLRHGFLSLVAAGADADFATALVHDPNYANSEVEAVQAEAIVEALQTQLWAGAFDEAAFLEGARLAAEVRGTPRFDFSGFDSQRLYDRAIALLDEWNRVAFHNSLSLEFIAGGG